MQTFKPVTVKNLIKKLYHSKTEVRKYVAIKYKIKTHDSKSRGQGGSTL